jgi:putative hydrolase of the HAD superfamily
VTSTGLHLIFDADDTLWENNILFERVIDDFSAWIAHPTLDVDTIRATLDDIERANAAAHGYGTKVFLRSLHDCFEHLLDQPPTAGDRARIDALAAPLLHHTVEPMPGVLDTLDALRERHDLLLLTKGDEEEQSGKIEASGLADHFRRIVIVREKTAAVYSELLATEALDADRAWMIGNSPKSDVLPALAAGMGAVFVPNENTWALEHATLDEGAGRFIRIERLADLLDHF